MPELLERLLASAAQAESIALSRRVVAAQAVAAKAIVGAFILNSAVDLTAKNTKITKTDSYAWIA